MGFRSEEGGIGEDSNGGMAKVGTFLSLFKTPTAIFAKRRYFKDSYQQVVFVALAVLPTRSRSLSLL